MSNKRVVSDQQYGRSQTDEVELKTRDGWFYVFQRPSENEPFQFKERRRPDGSLSERRDRVPEAVVEYMDTAYDSANLHPEFKRGETTTW